MSLKPSSVGGQKKATLEKNLSLTFNFNREYFLDIPGIAGISENVH
jgi:hypothetical protein